MNGRRRAQELLCGEDRAARNDVGRAQGDVIYLWRVRYLGSAKAGCQRTGRKEMDRGKANPCNGGR